MNWNRTKRAGGILVTAVVLMCALCLSLRGEVFDIVDYPSQHPVIDSLRTELFYVDKDNKVWAEFSPFYHDFYQTRIDGEIEAIKDRPELEYHLWLQDNPADLVVILPGLGGHFTSGTATAFADMFYKNGYSALIISSAMNWEFMEAAGSVLVPGYVPQDADDVRNALLKILAQLDAKYPGKVKRRILCGYSLGAIHTLFISNTDYNEKKPIFSRYLAINPPVNMRYGLQKIDDFYMVGAKWTGAQIQEKIKKAVKAYMRLVTRKMKNTEKLNFEVDEAKFLVGYSFHMKLGDIIYSIHRRHDMGIIKAKSSWYNREKLYDEIDTFTYEKYLDKFLLKFYSEKWKHPVTVDELNRKSSLHAIEASLLKNTKIKILHTTNDFLLTEADRAWLRKTLGERIDFYTEGGHLGNFYVRKVQQSILDGIKDQ